MTTKLTGTLDRKVAYIAKYGKVGYANLRTTHEAAVRLVATGLVKQTAGVYELTDAGREYAQSRGWIASEAATVEAQQPAHEPTQAGEGFMRPCEHCNGVGSKLDAYDGYSRPCEYCDGTGIHDGTRIPLDMIPDAHFTDVAQLATYASERSTQYAETQARLERTGYIESDVTATDATPLAVLHEAIKALSGVNDPALRTRDCVERTERALGLLVDELLPMVGQLQSDLALFVGVFNKLSKRVRRDNVGLGDAWEYTITISDVRRLTLETAAKEVERKLESKGG